MRLFLNVVKFIFAIISFSVFLFVLIIYPILLVIRKVKLISNKKQINIEENIKLNRPKSEYKRLQSEKTKLEHDIKFAENIDKELSLARNRRERFLLHQKCGSKFEYESPSKVINDRRNRISSIERNIIKLKKRIETEERIANRKINHIILDGNNLCFDRGEFINTKALSKLLSSLPNDLEKTVVFDSSIKRRTGKSDREIETSLSKYAQTYIAPAKTEADDYIIKIAEKDKNSYIISNDKYSDFFDTSPVIEKRVIPFMIIRNNIIVKDMNIDELF